MRSGLVIQWFLKWPYIISVHHRSIIGHDLVTKMHALFAKYKTHFPMEQLLNFLNGFVIRKRVGSKRHLQLVYFTDLESWMTYKHTCSALAFGSIRVRRKCHFDTLPGQTRPWLKNRTQYLLGVLCSSIGWWQHFAGFCSQDWINTRIGPDKETFWT